MPKYAEKTDVTAEKSKLEIERILTRYGATAFMYGWDGAGAVIGFRLKERLIRFRLPFPDREAEEFRFTPDRRLRRSDEAAHAAWEQATRQRWRALALVIKAKLEAVEAGVVTVEDEFLSATVLPDNSTLGEWAAPQLDRMYASGEMPELLPGADRRALPPGNGRG